MEIRADVSAAQAACPTNEQRLNIGQPDIIRPLVAADRGPMAAMVIRAIDQQAANAHLALFA